MTLNPNFPVLEYGWGPRWNLNAATIPLDQYVDLTANTRGGTGFIRGRQYETDQVRSAQLTTTITNKLGELDPTNTAGPWYGHVSLYQPLRLRAQWPPTQNLLTPVQATGGDLGGYATGVIPQGNTGIAVASATDSTGGTITISGNPWQGSRVFMFNVPASTVSGTSICATSQPAVAPGQPYTVQLEVRNVTASTSVQVAAYIAWYNAAGTLISTTVGTTATLTGSTSSTWTQVTASTATAPSTTAYATFGVRTAATSPGSALSVQVDGWQVEQAAAPTTWTAPGTWYPMYAGFVTRYPQQWTANGTYGTVAPETYDAFAVLSQQLLRDPLLQEINSRKPRFVYTLGDPLGTSQAVDAAGNMPFAPLTISKNGAGSWAFGTQITAANPTTGIFTGSTGTVATLANPNPGTGTSSAATYLDLTQAGIKGPSGGTWSRAIAYRYTGAVPTATNQATIWAGFGANYQLTPIPAGSQVTAAINSSGYPTVTISDDAGSGGTLTISTNTADSNWHLLIFGAKNGQMFVSLDGVYSSGATGYGTQSTLVKDAIGAWLDPTRTFDTIFNYAGDLAFACEWPAYLAAADCTAVFTAWKTAFAGESSGTRYARILGWAGYTGPTSIQSGTTTSMGPAAVGGQDALSALQAVVDTENGNHYVDRSGTLTFKARGDRYNQLTPAYTFGEQTSLGEIPYEGVAFDYDDTHIANVATITQQSTGQAFTSQDTTSVTAYGPRVLTRTVNVTAAQEALDAANYLESRYRQPSQRISTLTLHPSANPTLLWPVCLALELGTRVRVMRRPPAPAPTTQIDCFIESISWRIERGDAVVTLQCSPVDITPYGVFASFHTTLATSPGAGVTTITINAGADNTNLARSQLTGGQQLVLGNGTANQETVTIAAGGVATTSPAWTTCVLTLTAATTKAHSSGDVVCEPLPAGTTDPTTWDGTVFDNRAFAY